eukprot:Hpha_TRINITY_DN22977_c0_g1::TRINITY_DN22977_c0_g1_i1::g.154083::m.154083
MGQCWPVGVKAPCPRCGELVPESALDSTHWGTCPGRVTRCPNQWCGSKMPAAQYQAHRRECDRQQRVKCLRCGEPFGSEEIVEHESACTEQVCPVCGDNVLRIVLDCCPKAFPPKRFRVRPPLPSELRPRAAVRLQRVWRWFRVRTVFRKAVWGLVWRTLDKAGERLVGPSEWNSGKTRRPTGTAIATPNFQKVRSPLRPDSIMGLTYPTGGLMKILRKDAANSIQELRSVLRQGKLTPEFFLHLCEESAAILSELPNVQRLGIPPQGELVIVGDLHGHYDDLEHILDHVSGLPGDSRCYIFNGDLVDRGRRGVEVLTLVLALSLLYPEYVSINRGNHEDIGCNRYYGFEAEVGRKINKDAYHQAVLPVFRAMPICCVVDGVVFVSHAGIPRDRIAQTLDFIDLRINRFRNVPEAIRTLEDRAFIDLLWSDPAEQEKPWGPNVVRGAGVLWGALLTQEFLGQNSPLKVIVRSHDPPPGGVDMKHSGRVITVFSASNYMGVESNAAAVLRLSRASHGAPGTLHDSQVASRMESWDTPEGGKGGESSHEDRARDREQVASQVEEAVVNRLQDAIDERGHHLLSVCNTLDPKGTGSVWRSEWAHACEEVTGIPGLPWKFLAPHITSMVCQNRVPYGRALSSVGIPTERRLWERWRTRCTMWLHFRAASLLGGVSMKTLWDEATARRGAPDVMHYDEFASLVTHKLQGAIPSRTVRLFYDSMDVSGTGVLVLKDFEAATEAARGMGVLFEEVRGTHRERGTFHMWDVWLLRRLRDLCGGMSGRQAFESLDADGDGALGVNDIKAAIAKMGIPAKFKREQVYLKLENEPAKDVAQLFGLKAVLVPPKDPNWEPYRRIVVDTWPLCDDQIEYFRQLIDADRDGTVTFPDFVQLFAVTTLDTTPCSPEGGRVSPTHTS